MSGTEISCGEQRKMPGRSRVSTIIMAILIVGILALEWFMAGQVVMVPLILTAIAVGAVDNWISRQHDISCDRREDERRAACWAGVIAGVQASFSSGWHILFPYAATHGYADIVVKRAYWPLVSEGAYWVHCTRGRAPSYVLRTYFYDSKVCSVSRHVNEIKGSLGLAVLAWGIGVLVGYGVAAAAAAALGCATVWGCPLAILLLIVVAIAVAVILLIVVAALIGNAVRALASSDSSDPAATEDGDNDDGETAAESGRILTVGDLVTVSGGVVTHQDFDGANVGWFAEEVMVHGNADGLPPTQATADTLLPDDGCVVNEATAE